MSTIRTEKVFKLVRVMVSYGARMPDGRDAVANTRDAFRIDSGGPRRAGQDGAIHDGAVLGVVRHVHLVRVS